MTYRVKAYAKVNLHLEVLNKRSDSYHNIFSLNASLDLFDRIIFKRLNIFNNSLKDTKIDIRSVKGEYANVISSIATEDNLITKAVKSYLSRVGKSGEILISVEKNIPAGAGLAGGSTDAAAALRLLNEYFTKLDQGLSENELHSIASDLGADVPYCLSGGYAICEGIGDIIEHIPGKLNYWILIADCGIAVNTADAYKLLNRNGKSFINDSEIRDKKKLFIEKIKSGDISIIKNHIKNDFENVIFMKYPELKSLKDLIYSFKPEYAGMTGSGAAIIGIFKTKKDAQTARKAIGDQAKIFLTKFYNTMH